MNLSGSLGAPTLKADLPQAVFTDFSSLDALRSNTAGDQSLAAKSDGVTEDSQLEAAAKQFSSIFLHMALKSMREASFGGGILDSQQSEFYRDMFDQQISLDLSQGEGFGLTQVIVDQLSGGANRSQSSTTPANAAQAYSKVAQTGQETAKTADTLTNKQHSIDRVSEVVGGMTNKPVEPVVQERAGSSVMSRQIAR